MHFVIDLKTDLIAVGLAGMIHNLYVAAAPRKSNVLGIHLKHDNTIVAAKVGKALQLAEARYPTLGSSLVPVFFPGGFRTIASDRIFWDEAAMKRGHRTAKDLGIEFE